MHTFITLDDDIYTLDTAAEIAHARQHMAEAGVASLPTYRGEAGEEGTPTGEFIRAAEQPIREACTACGVEVDQDGSCPQCTYAERAARDLPVDEDIARVLMTLIDPESDEDMRAEAMEMITGSAARVDVRSYRDAGMLTRDQGFILRIGIAEFQVTVRAR
jgi:hypothetical protein